MGEAVIDPALVGKLELVEEGLWRAPGSAVVSYPAEVHDDLFAVEDASF